jgi:hypothetical protein
MTNKEIPLLGAADIDCRVQSVSQAKSGKVGAVLLLYKDARVDMRILDEVFGSGNWKRTHEVINGNLFCNIDIWDDDKKEWVRKQDVGVESNADKEKGQASDAFKRAGFNVGIGRELYTAPFVYVELSESEYTQDGQRNGKPAFKCWPNTRFTVKHVAYNERREIAELIITDRFGAVRYDMKNPSAGNPPQGGQNGRQAGRGSQPTQGTRTAQGRPQGAPQAPQGQAQDAGSAVCPICGGTITQPERDYSLRKFGREACRACQKKL